MKRALLILLCFSRSTTPGDRIRDSYLTFGPMYHLNFGIGKGQIKHSFALEAALWVFTGRSGGGEFAPPNYNVGYGFDLGVELEKPKVRLYLEPQIGRGFFGLSAGPVLEFSKEANPSYGFQASAWGNWWGGADIRYRRINQTYWVAPGLYVKLLMTQGRKILERE